MSIQNNYHIISPKDIEKYAKDILDTPSRFNADKTKCIIKLPEGIMTKTTSLKGLRVYTYTEILEELKNLEWQIII